MEETRNSKHVSVRYGAMTAAAVGAFSPASAAKVTPDAALSVARIERIAQSVAQQIER